MKRPGRYIYPLLLGLLIYTSIRLVTDTVSGEKFWIRKGPQNMIEIGGVVIMSYIMDIILGTFLKRFNRKKEKFRLASVLLEFVTLVIAALLIINPVVVGIHYWIGDPVSVADLTIANVIVLLYVLLYYSIVRGNNLLSSYIEQKTQIERLQNEGLRTELKFLKAQYHPHFLFNALNTIYFQMDEDVQGAKQTVQQFAELLRYQLYDQQQPVTVRQELTHLQNYIDLQKARASSKLNLNTHLPADFTTEKLYPLLLLPLVENAFKYVGGEYRMSIDVIKESDGIVLRVENSVSPLIAEKKSGGIGLENLKRRLDLLYPGIHDLQTRRDVSNYIAELRLGYLHD